MRKFFRVTCLSLICILAISLAGCGNKTSDNTEPDIDTAVSASAPELANNNTAVPMGDVSIESLLGNWVDINDETRFGNITKTDSGYQFEDNDGKYQGQYNDGVLQIKVTENDLADIYYSSTDETLILDFQGDVIKFKKK